MSGRLGGRAPALMLLIAILALGLPRLARAIDLTFAGSGSLEYHTFIGASTHAVPQPSSIGLDGLTLELAQKVVLDVSKNVNVNVKVCYGCHGVELDQGYAELHWKDALSIRAGRINVPIGEFNARHDPANYSAPSKPLPYAMGDLLYYRSNEFNLGVVPTPYSDNGAEAFGSFWLGKRITLDYTLYLVRGFVGTNDLDFVETRSWIARKRYPSLGGRVVASFGPVSIGGSVSWGYYDPEGKLMYLIYGAEAYARWRTLTLRAEYIARQTDYDQSLPGYLFVPKEHYFVKAGYYAQLDWDPLSWLTVLARIDGLYRAGMPLPGSLITSDLASILRATAGLALRFGGYFMFKAGYEFWHFNGVPFEDEHVVRTALLFSY